MELDRYYGRIAERGVEVSAVSVDPPASSKRLKARLGSDLTFLSDVDAKLLDALGIRQVGAHEGRDIAYPTQVLVDGDGIVRWTYETDDVRRRAHPDDVFKAIAGLPAARPPTPRPEPANGLGVPVTPGEIRDDKPWMPAD